MSETSLTNFLSFVERLAGLAVDSSIRERVMQLPAKDLVEIRLQYLELFTAFRNWIGQTEREGTFPGVYLDAPRPYVTPSEHAGEFRPFIHGRLNNVAERFGGDSGLVWTSIDSPEVALSGLKQHLLYAHRLVLPDPLFYILQSADRVDDTNFEQSRQGLANFLQFLSSIRDLIEANIVFFYPQYEHGYLPEQLFVDESFHDWFLGSVTEGNAPHTDPLATHALQEIVVELTYYCTRYHASCAIADDERSAKWLEGLFRYSRRKDRELGQALGNPVITKQQAAYQRLIQLSLKVPSGLSIDDLVQARHSSAGFAEWRSALSQCLELIDSDSTSEKDLQKAITELTVPTVEKLDAEVARSSLLAKAFNESRDFMLGSTSAGLAITMLAGGPVSALAIPTGVIISSAMKVLAAWMGARDEARSLSALRKHYVLWA
jgi:hypothetical protein